MRRLLEPQQRYYRDDKSIVICICFKMNEKDISCILVLGSEQLRLVVAIFEKTSQGLQYMGYSCQ